MRIDWLTISSFGTLLPGISLLRNPVNITNHDKCLPAPECRTHRPDVARLHDFYHVQRVC